MKFLGSLAFIVFLAGHANAEIILSCRLAEEDLEFVTVSQYEGQYFLTEVTKRGDSINTEISAEDVENEHYRLSDGKYGFRYLSMMYSDIFNEFNWFVESRGGFAYTISRATCE